MTFASARRNRRQRAAVSVAPLREIPGASANACAAPITIASIRRASSRRRSSGRPSAIAIATEPVRSAIATGRGCERRRSIGRSNRNAIRAAGVNESVRLAMFDSPNVRR
jgi:hypothetical protein